MFFSPYKIDNEANKWKKNKLKGLLIYISFRLASMLSIHY